MIRPESMTLAEFVCSREDGDALFEELYACGTAEIERSSRLTDTVIAAIALPDDTIAKAKDLLSTAEKALSAMGEDIPDYRIQSIPSVIKTSCSESSRYSSKSIDTEKMNLKNANSELDKAERLLASAEYILTAEKKCREEKILLTQAENRKGCRKWITSLGIDPDKCRSSARCRIYCGTIPAHSAKALSEEHGLISISPYQKKNAERYILAAEEPALQRIRDLLHREGFSPIDISLPAADDTGTDEQKSCLDSFRQNIPDIRAAHAILTKYLSIADAAQRCGLTGHCIHAAVWIPSKNAGSVIRNACAALRGRGDAAYVSAETAVKDTAFRWEEIPSHLSPSQLLDPFRMIFSVYAVPAYRHVDPAIPGGLFFLLFFGMMFADAGHGLVILAIGALLRIFMRRQSLRNAGVLMIFCGSAASFCGLMFGSFFGRDDIIPPILFHPAEHIGTFLLLGVAIGLIVISAGIILNIVQKFWQRENAEAVFSQWGILTLGFYWLCAGILAASIFSSITMHIPAVIAITTLPLAAVVAGEAVIKKRKGTLEAAETAFLPVEIILGLLSNSVSFVRIAAFGLCHIALMSAVYIIASSGPDSFSYRLSVAIDGNIFVILLEALVVSIQCLRLQFYEFFSKFFSAQGRPFSPLR